MECGLESFADVSPANRVHYLTYDLDKLNFRDFYLPRNITDLFYTDTSGCPWSRIEPYFDSAMSWRYSSPTI